MNDDRKEQIKIQSSKWNNYQYRIHKDGYTLSIVSGRTDVPGLDNCGYFEIAIWKEHGMDMTWKDGKTSRIADYDNRELRIVDYGLDFIEVAMHISRFKEMPELLFSQARE